MTPWESYWGWSSEIATGHHRGPRNDEGEKGRVFAMTVPGREVFPHSSLRGGAFFAPTRQSLVPEDSTNGNEGAKSEIASAHRASLAMTKPGVARTRMRKRKVKIV